MISAKHVNISYGKKLVVRDASMSASPNKVTAIVGPSGCGKSSFLFAINRMTDLISSARVSGEIFLDGVDVNSNDMSALELRRRVGLIFQKPNPFPMSIRRNIHLPLREHGVKDSHQLNTITQNTLEAVGLWEEVEDRLDQPALQLSGGQQQRLCIARALALEPEVLLMDEPCSALDPIATSKVESLIDSLRKRYTILMVTHNLAQARRLADEMVIFWYRDGAGEIIEQGPANTMWESPSNPVTAAYLSGEQG